MTRKRTNRLVRSFSNGCRLFRISNATGVQSCRCSVDEETRMRSKIREKKPTKASMLITYVGQIASSRPPRQESD